jgi:hypothetical protein
MTWVEVGRPDSRFRLEREVMVGEGVTVPRFVTGATELMPEISEGAIDHVIRLAVIFGEDVTPRTWCLL